MTLRHRISPFRRGLSALLAALYLAVAFGATRHAGEHDESGLEWLPERFHHHHYEVVADGDDHLPGLHELCAACHWNRLGQRLIGEIPAAPEAGPVLRLAVTGLDAGALDGASLLPDSRGPPSA